MHIYAHCYSQLLSRRLMYQLIFGIWRRLLHLVIVLLTGIVIIKHTPALHQQVVDSAK